MIYKELIDYCCPDTFARVLILNSMRSTPYSDACDHLIQGALQKLNFTALFRKECEADERDRVLFGKKLVIVVRGLDNFGTCYRLRAF